MKALLTAALLLLAVLPAAASDPLVVFAVRHAEKASGKDAGPNPGLTAAGRERAALLARMLDNAELGFVHSTDYARTRSTAAAVAKRHGLAVRLYDPSDPGALAGEIAALGGRHLVVGHSNTTTSLVEQLGGDPGFPIDDAGEFDRLYIVTPGDEGGAATVLLRYGRPYTPGD